MFNTTFLDLPNFAPSSLDKKESPNKRIAGVSLVVEGFVKTAEVHGSSLVEVELSSGLYFLNDRLNLMCSSQSAVLPGSTLC